MKKLGQHFLKDKDVIERLCHYAVLGEKDTVLEVGCGSGNITEVLLKKSKVIGVEIDKKYLEVLEDRFSNEIDEGKLQIIRGDALRVLRENPPSFNKLVSNIPFKISSPLIFELFKLKYEVAVLILQKEFGLRLTAEAGSKDYGKLSVIPKIYCTSEILEFVTKEAFEPAPEVDCAIVKLYPVPKLNIRVQKREEFGDFIKFVFSQRRKKMGKILKTWNDLKNDNIVLKNDLAKERPENISPENFIMIFESGGSIQLRKMRRGKSEKTKKEVVKD